MHDFRTGPNSPTSSPATFLSRFSRLSCPSNSPAPFLDNTNMQD